MALHIDTTNCDQARIIHRSSDHAFSWPTVRWYYEDGTHEDETLDDGDLSGLRSFIAAGGSIESDVLGVTNREMSEDDLADWSTALRALCLVEVMDEVLDSCDRDGFLALVERKHGAAHAEWQRLHIASAEQAGATIDISDPCWLDFSGMPNDIDVDDVRDAFDRAFA